MSNNKKISSKKVKQFIGMTLLLSLFAIVLIAANRKQSSEVVAGVIVTLKNQNTERNFLLRKDVEQLFLTDQHINLKDQTLASLDLDKIERIALSNPWVQAAEVFVDNNNKLNIEVSQRLPVARLFDVNGNSFYLDSTGFQMPLSNHYAYAVPVFTNYRKLQSDSINQLQQRSIIELSSLVKADSFWNAQISQIAIVGYDNYDMYTTIGRQKVKFGAVALANEKFENLKSFYKEVSNKIGWDRYDVLDVRFKGQVVASPSLGWTPPKDTAANIPVENTVVKTEPKPLPAKPATVVAPVEKKPNVAPAKKPVVPVAKATNNKTNAAKPTVAKPATKPVEKNTNKSPKYEYKAAPKSATNDKKKEVPKKDTKQQDNKKSNKK